PLPGPDTVTVAVVVKQPLVGVDHVAALQSGTDQVGEVLRVRLELHPVVPGAPEGHPSERTVGEPGEADGGSPVALTREAREDGGTQRERLHVLGAAVPA